jgi:ribosomal protein S6
VRSYELVFIVHPEVDEDGLTAVTEKVEGLIKRNVGWPIPFRNSGKASMC